MKEYVSVVLLEDFKIQGVRVTWVSNTGSAGGRTSETETSKIMNALDDLFTKAWQPRCAV
jgi:hypothetical protein